MPENNGKFSDRTTDPLLKPFELTDKMLEDDFDTVYRDYPLPEEATCGYGIFRGSFLQK